MLEEQEALGEMSQETVYEDCEDVELPNE